MKKKSLIWLLFVTFVTASLSLAGCADEKVACGNTYQPYGLIDESDHKKSEATYKVSWGNVVLGCVFVKTIFAPLLVFGYYLYEPIEVDCKKITEPGFNKEQL